MLRNLINDEGCDIECGMCGRRHLTGKCLRCGYVTVCCGCGEKAEDIYANEVHEDGVKHVSLVAMCKKCAEACFETQNDDSRCI